MPPPRWRRCSSPRGAAGASTSRLAPYDARVCFELDSSPPIPVIRGAAVSHEDVVLEADDGNRFAAFAAAPEGPTEVGIVILPDVRGLYRFYEELALRFAERDIAAVAFDYFGRTAGASKRDEEFEYRPHVDETTTPTVQADIAACIAYLREPGAARIFSGCGGLGCRNARSHT